MNTSHAVPHFSFLGGSASPPLPLPGGEGGSRHSRARPFFIAAPLAQIIFIPMPIVDDGKPVPWWLTLVLLAIIVVCIVWAFNGDLDE